VEVFGFGDVLGADQDRLTGAVHLDDVVDDGFVLGPGGDVALGLLLARLQQVGGAKKAADVVVAGG
jgi:hypothetical protein